MNSDSEVPRTNRRSWVNLKMTTAMLFSVCALGTVSAHLALAASLFAAPTVALANAISAIAQVGCAQSFSVQGAATEQMTPAVFQSRWQPVAPSVARSVQALLSAHDNQPSAKLLLPRLGAIQEELLKDIDAPKGLRAVLARMGPQRQNQTSADILLSNETLRFRKAQLEADLLALSYLAGFRSELPQETQHLSFVARWTEPVRLKFKSLLHSESSSIWNVTRAVLRPLLSGTNDLVSFAAAFIIGRPHAHRAPYPSPLSRTWMTSEPSGPLTHAQWTALQTQMLNSTTQAILSERERPWYKALKPLHWKQRLQYTQTVAQKIFLALTIAIVVGYTDQMGSQALAIAELQTQEADLNRIYSEFSDQDLIDAYEQLLVVKWMEQGQWSSEIPDYSEDQRYLLAEAARLSRTELIKKLDRLRIELHFSVEDIFEALVYIE